MLSINQTKITLSRSCYVYWSDSCFVILWVRLFINCFSSDVMYFSLFKGNSVCVYKQCKDI